MRRKQQTVLRAAAGLVCVAFLGSALGACDLKKKDDDAATAAPAPPPPPAPDPNAAAQPAQNMPPAPGAASPMPTQQDWMQAQRVQATNADVAACQVQQLREWVRVACGAPTAASGNPVDVVVSRPGVGSPMREVTGGVALVFPFVEGQDLEATFVWQKQARQFTSRWQQGTPQPAMVGAFGAPIQRVRDECDHDRDCGSGWQCCLTSGSRGVCKPAGRNVCQAQNLYTKCSTDSECRRERGSKHVCQYNSSVGAKVCVWDQDGSRKTTNDQGDKNKEKPAERPVLRPGLRAR